MDVFRFCTQAQWRSFCQTWLCLGRRENAELCWYNSGKAANMARLADYFIVVGYDHEKAGKFGCVQLSDWGLCPGRQSVVVMLMLHSLKLATRLGEYWKHFLFFSLTDQLFNTNPINVFTGQAHSSHSVARGCPDTTGFWCLTWNSRNFSRFKFSHPVPVDRSYACQVQCQYQPEGKLVHCSYLII